MNQVINTIVNRVKQMNLQQAITAAVLMLLVVAVQVSTDRAGDWMFIGLNLIEMGCDNPLNLSDVSDVTVDVTVGDTEFVQQIVTRVLESIITGLTQ
ncbi:hypothetical protein [Shewanella sp. 125m-1]